MQRRQSQKGVEIKCSSLNCGNFLTREQITRWKTVMREDRPNAVLLLCMSACLLQPLFPVCVRVKATKKKKQDCWIRHTEKRSGEDSDCVCMSELCEKTCYPSSLLCSCGCWSDIHTRPHIMSFCSFSFSPSFHSFLHFLLSLTFSLLNSCQGY